MQSSSSRSYGEATAEAGAAAKLRHVVLGGAEQKKVLHTALVQSSRVLAREFPL